MNMSRPERLPIFATLKRALGILGRHSGAYLKAIIVVQGAIVLVGAPLMAVLFDFALSRSGMAALTTDDLVLLILDPFSGRWLVTVSLILIGILGAVLVYVEIAALMAIARRHQLEEPVSLRAIVGDVGRATKKLAHPSILLLIPYFFLVLPIGNIGLSSVLTQGISVPAFISGELLKTESGTWIYLGTIAVFVYLNLRWVFTISNFVGSTATVGRSMRTSWRMSGWLPWRIASIFAIIYAVGAALVLGAYAIALLPTRLTDEIAPGASPVVAGISLTVLQVVVFVIFGVAAAMIANVTVAAGRIGEPRAQKLEWYPRDSTPAAPAAATPAEPAKPQPGRRGVKTAVIAATVVLLTGVSAVNVAVILSLSQSDSTLVIAHRGITQAGVENSIEALEAAADRELNGGIIDYVELDIQETKDRELVVVHDAGVGRLTGVQRGVGEMTLAELRELTQTQGPFEAAIPTLDDFIETAKKIDVNLLIELKPRGDESPDYMDNVVAAFERHDVTDRYMAHSLSKASIEELEARLPAVETGYILAFNFGHAPDTTADFVVIEESAYSSTLLEELREKGLGVVLWTVDDTQAMRNYLRDNVDGMITDYPDIALAERGSIHDDTGVLSRLQDTARRLFGI